MVGPEPVVLLQHLGVDGVAQALQPIVDADELGVDVALRGRQRRVGAEERLTERLLLGQQALELVVEARLLFERRELGVVELAALGVEGCDLGLERLGLAGAITVRSCCCSFVFLRSIFPDCSSDRSICSSSSASRFRMVWSVWSQRMRSFLVACNWSRSGRLARRCRSWSAMVSAACSSSSGAVIGLPDAHPPGGGAGGGGPESHGATTRSIGTDGSGAFGSRTSGGMVVPVWVGA